ncbi:MAG: type II toxin-antitoxin system HicB family antitoxin [Geminicoccaceae bacterium]
MAFAYPIEIREMTPEEGGRLLVEFPDWDAVTEGDDLADALYNAIDCLEEMLADRIVRREGFPEPSPARGRRTVAPGSLIAAKAALWLSLREQSVSLNELARRLGHDSTLQVRRLLDPRHASRLELIDAALAALGKRLVVELADVA